jgi:tetratricopeptide (TPR) repeat protein
MRTMSLFRKVLLLCFSAEAVSLPVYTQDIRFTADSRITGEAFSQEILKPDIFAYTALVASGAADTDIPGMLAQLDRIYGQISGSISRGQTDREKAEQTLYQLYTGVLSQYSETQTFVNTALTSGVYNCVSSDILFMYMMKREGIPVTAVETPLHAFCTVNADGRNIDVETTNPYGFDPGAKKELPSASPSQKKYVTVPAKNYINRHNIDDRRIISLIYNNRISILQKQKKDYETAGLAVDAVKLQNNSPQSLSTFFQCIYNIAVDYTDAGKNEDGLAFTAQAESLFGDSPLYHTYASAAVGNILNRYMSQNNYDGSFAVLEKYRTQLDESDYRDMYNGTLVNSLNYAVSTEPFAEALSRITDNKSALPETQYAKLVAFAYSNEAADLADTGAWLDAASLLDRGLQEIPSDGTLSKQRNIYRRNYAAEIHNKAAALYNAGDREGALNVVRQGLKLVSDSTILQNDLKRLQQ